MNRRVQTKTWWATLLTVSAFALGSSGVLAQHAGGTHPGAVVAGGNVTLVGAKEVMVAAMGLARSQGAPGGAIAIVDAGGSLVLLERLDGTFPSASRVATGKARTAAEFRKPTKVFEDAVNGGRISMTALADFIPLQGGIPLVVDGVVVGAIGVSGASSAAQDEQIALAGAASLNGDPS